jgi:hypothetical protein
MKKALSLLAITMFVVSSHASYVSHPENFKRIVDVFKGTPGAEFVRKSVVDAYRQVREVMMNTKMMCQQHNASKAKLKTDFTKPAKAFLKNIEGRVAKFKSMNAEALLTPLQGIVTEVLTSNKDFETMLTWATQEINMYLAAIA